MTTPSPADLAAYHAGRLDLLKFEEVDRWLASQTPDEQARILDGSSDTVVEAMPGMAPPERLAGAFAADNPGPRRFSVGERLGAGGMGIVETARDEVLGREVALKRCRPRRPDESMANWAARLRAFKREAAITAQLEHPAIVPVHDVGTGPNGEPAFLMKRLEGEPLSALIARRRAGEALDVARVAELVLRVAEAIGYAHRKNIVHRDLKPDNIIVGALGAVHVIDWGLAAAAVARHSAVSPDMPPTAVMPAETPTSQTTGTYRVGTPDWMAPEQVVAVAPDPRMDVFALGGLLMALLTGYGPRDLPGPQGAPARVSVNLTPLDARGLPRGLVAVARRCLAIDRTLRYPDGSAVADELRRWQRAGLTQAERPSAFTRITTGLRRSPRLVATAIGVLVAITALAVATTTQRLHARQRLIDEVTALSLRTDLRDMDSVHAALAQLSVLLRDGDAPMEAREFQARLTAAQDIFTAQRVLAERRAQLRLLQHKYRLKGPWPDEERELLAALTAAEYLRGDVERDQQRLRADPLAPEVLAALVQLHRTRLLRGATAPQVMETPRLIAKAGPTPAWRALGSVLAQTTVVEHDLVLCHCPESEVALSEAATADLMLASYGPDPRLVRVAWERWHEDSAAFWPRIMTARDRIIRGDWRAAERHALVALGSEPDSLWPHLILAYVALADGDWASLLRESDAGITENLDHLELVVLKAVALARLGRGEQAQNLVDNSNQAGHLRYHLTHQGEHPMRRAVEALVAAGVRVADAPAILTPVVQPKPTPAPSAK